MFQGFTGETISFYLDIRFHNEISFMHAHRDEYIAKVRDPFYEFIEAISPAVLAIDPGMETRPSKALSRIFRDTRFSKDKSPYRDHHWVSFRRAGESREGGLFFWFELRVEGATWGLGFWGENKNAMDALRRRMTAKPDELLSLLPLLEENGFTLGGESFKRLATPEGLPEALVPWYRMRSIYLEKACKDPGLPFSPELIPAVSRDYKLLIPFYRLFRGLIDIEA